MTVSIFVCSWCGCCVDVVIVFTAGFQINWSRGMTEILLTFDFDCFFVAPFEQDVLPFKLVWLVLLCFLVRCRQKNLWICPTNQLMHRQLRQRDHLVSPLVNFVCGIKSQLTMTTGSMCVTKGSVLCAEQHTASGESEEVGDVMQCCLRLRKKIVASKKEEKRKHTGGSGTRRSSLAVSQLASSIKL